MKKTRRILSFQLNTEPLGDMYITVISTFGYTKHEKIWGTWTIGGWWESALMTRVAIIRSRDEI